MSQSTTTVRNPLEVARVFTDAYARGDTASVAHLLHSQIHERAVVAGGYDVDVRGRDAYLAEIRDFLTRHQEPVILHHSVEPVGNLFRWSLRWRLHEDGNAVLIDKHAFLTIENGLITRVDEVCTGKLPEQA